MLIRVFAGLVIAACGAALPLYVEAQRGVQAPGVSLCIPPSSR